jgi:hypothetical protein
MLSRILKILAPGENKTSSAAPTKKESPFDFLPEDVRKEYDKLITILPNLLIDKRADKLALGMIKRFLEFVWDLPASEGHHHARPFGLFLHSLETAINNLKIFENKLFFQFKDGTIDSYQTRVVKPREQYAYFLTGLLYDIGEAAQYSISSERADKHASRKVDYIVQYLKESLNDIPHDTNSHMKFNSLMRGISDIMLHAQDILINKNNDEALDESWKVIDDLQLIEIYALLVAGLLHDIGKASEVIITSEDNAKWCPLKEGLYFFLKRNGGNVQREYIGNKAYSLHKKMTPIFASIIMSPNDYNYIGLQNFAELIMGSKFKGTAEADEQSAADDVTENVTKTDITGTLLETIRNLITSGRFPLNTRMPGAWIMDDHTAIAYSIVEEARIALQNSGHRVTSKIILNRLTERKYVKVDGWKAIFTMTIETKGSPFQQNVVQFRNDILWKDMTKPAICTLNLKFASDAEAKKEK